MTKLIERNTTIPTKKAKPGARDVLQLMHVLVLGGNLGATGLV